MPQASEFHFPTDALVPLGVAFDMIGAHRFGARWTTDMTAAVRLGQRSRDPDQRALGCWALKALTQCVENGWLPLIYFSGRKRIRYFEAPNGLALHALYPRPTSDFVGQIELDGGDIFPCMVDVSRLGQTLREKFGKRQGNSRGRPPEYREIDGVLDTYFMDNPPSTPNVNVIQDIGRLVAESSLPRKTTLHDRINKARDRAKDRAIRIQSAN